MIYTALEMWIASLRQVWRKVFHYGNGSLVKDVSPLERCPHFRGCYVHVSVELGPEDTSILEKYHHFRGCYIKTLLELGREDVSLLERCPHFRTSCY